jgi:MHS family proline/betaine transporter-like MFS transporter
MRRNVAAAAIGNFLEFYDFILFGVFAGTLGRVFFPATSPTNATLLAFATFGVAAFTRPLGAVVLGRYSDRTGRKAGLTLTVSLMAFSTAAIGLLPGYRTLGIASPLLLVALRLIQGFSAGGEFGGATAFLTEHAPARSRGYYAGWLQTGTFASAALASAMGVAFLAPLQSGNPGEYWRLPFLLGALLAPVGVYMRRHLPETELFRAERAANPLARPLRTLFSREWGRLLQMVGAVLPATVGSYVILLYLPHYARSNLGIGTSASLYGGILASLVSAALCPVAGAMSDRYGRRRMMIGAMLVSALLLGPLFSFILSHHGTAAFVAVNCLLGALLAFFAGPMTALGAELFQTGARSSGLSIGYGLAAGTFGNFTPLVLAWGINASGNPLMPAWYLCAMLVLGTFAVMTTTGRTGQSLARAVDTPAEQGHAPGPLGRAEQS